MKQLKTFRHLVLLKNSQVKYLHQPVIHRGFFFKNNKPDKDQNGKGDLFESLKQSSTQSQQTTNSSSKSSEDLFNSLKQSSYENKSNSSKGGTENLFDSLKASSQQNSNQSSNNSKDLFNSLKQSATQDNKNNSFKGVAENLFDSLKVSSSQQTINKSSKSSEDLYNSLKQSSSQEYKNNSFKGVAENLFDSLKISSQENKEKPSNHQKFNVLNSISSNVSKESTKKPSENLFDSLKESMNSQNSTKKPSEQLFDSLKSSSSQSTKSSPKKTSEDLFDSLKSFSSKQSQSTKSTSEDIYDSLKTSSKDISSQKVNDTSKSFTKDIPKSGQYQHTNKTNSSNYANTYLMIRIAYGMVLRKIKEYVIKKNTLKYLGSEEQLKEIGYIQKKLSYIFSSREDSEKITELQYQIEELKQQKRKLVLDGLNKNKHIIQGNLTYWKKNIQDLQKQQIESCYNQIIAVYELEVKLIQKFYYDLFLFYLIVQFYFKLSSIITPIFNIFSFKILRIAIAAITYQQGTIDSSHLMLLSQLIINGSS